MKKNFGKIIYDTDTAILVAKHAVGEFGDPTGYEESLYKTEDGKYFVYTNGGEESKYTKETIKQMSAKKAEEWLLAHGL